MELKGWVSEYWEQGMEGAVWRIFQDSAHAASRNGGWDRAGMHILGEGDALTIWGLDGAALWSGTIGARREGLFGLRKVNPQEPRWTPEGVTLAQWAGWFRHQPPLEATFRAASR